MLNIDRCKRLLRTMGGINRGINQASLLRTRPSPWQSRWTSSSPFSEVLNPPHSFTTTEVTSIETFSVPTLSRREDSYLRLIPHICHFFTRAKFLENKIYTKIYTVNCQFLALKFVPAKKKFTRVFPWLLWQIWGIYIFCLQFGTKFCWKAQKY